MHLRTKRRLVTACIIGLGVCGVVLLVMNLCDSTDRDVRMHSVENAGWKRDPDGHKQKKYHFVTNLLIVVLSAPTHMDVRNVVRETWARNLPLGTSIRFVIGNKGMSEGREMEIRSENDTAGDIIFLDQIEESYSVLTRKVLEMFKYAHEHIKFNFLLKVDEDSFVCADRILDELLSKPQERLYWGFFDGRAHVKKAGKWQEENYVLCDRYIPYALGGGYVISKDLVAYVSQNSHLLQVFKNEDVSLGTWLAPLDIKRVHDPNFDTEYRSRGCFNSYVVTHKKSPEQLQSLQHNLDTSGLLCDKEGRVRLSYKYDWSVLPSQCCERKDPSVP